MYKILFKFCTSSYLTIVLYAEIYGKSTIWDKSNQVQKFVCLLQIEIKVILKKLKTIFLQPTPTSKYISQQKNMFWWYFNIYLKTLNAYN